MTSSIQEFNFNVNLLRAIIWQYENAENLKSILEKKQEWYDVNYKDIRGFLYFFSFFK